MPFLNLSTRQIIALFSSAAFLVIVANAFILFGLNAPKKVLDISLLSPGQPELDPEVSAPSLPAPCLRASQYLTYENSSRSSQTGAMSTATTTRILSTITTPYIGKSSKEAHHGIATRKRGKPHPKTSPVLSCPTDHDMEGVHHQGLISGTSLHAIGRLKF
jgi:hypothetical protein